MAEPSIELEFAPVRALSFEPYTMFRVRTMKGRHVNVTDAGYRADGRASVWPPDPRAASVFVFGGSTAFGYGVSDAETIPSQLGNQLTESMAGQAVAVYNFATPNYSSVQERIRLEQLILDGHQPRVAIFIDGFDEFIAPYYAPVMQLPFINALRPRRTFGKILDLVRRARPDESQCQLPNPASVLDRYFSNARLIKAVCSEFGVRPLFVWQPVPCYRYDGAAEHSVGHGSAGPLVERVRRGYEMIERRCGELSSEEFLTLANMQRGRFDNLYVDADHYTPAFSGEIAVQIAQYMIGHALLR